ncbi:MAG: N-acetylglucosamine-6-phosphate deacetylase [Cellvibrionales bacterium]|nr:N-acetylglucosamine-6-phosphate deacetylase [Cellvibrionales bacterium]
MAIRIKGDIFDGETLRNDHQLVIDGDKIAQIASDGNVTIDYTNTIDYTDKWIVPGFIDCQVNGGGGVLLNDETSETGLKAMVEAHSAFGTVAMLPTLISDTLEKAQQAMQVINESDLPEVVGIHLEGPFLNKNKKGVHDDQFFSVIDQAALQQLSCAFGKHKLITLAPEKQPKGTIKQLIDNGWQVFAGHTDASIEACQQAIDEGLRGFTHLYNAMSPLMGRAPNAVGAALLADQCYCGVIADGFHVHPECIKLAIKAKPRGKVFLVTDSMSTVGSSNKSFMLNDKKIQAKGGKLETEEGVLAGADLDMHTAVKNMAKWLDGDWQEAVRMASAYPAKCLGLDDKLGYLKAGFNASFVVINKDFTIDSVWINGKKK